MAGAATELAKPVMGTIEPGPGVLADAVVYPQARQRGAQENQRRGGEHGRGNLRQLHFFRPKGQRLPRQQMTPPTQKARRQSRATRLPGVRRFTFSS